MGEAEVEKKEVGIHGAELRHRPEHYAVVKGSLQLWVRSMSNGYPKSIYRLIENLKCSEDLRHSGYPILTPFTMG